MDIAIPQAEQVRRKRRTLLKAVVLFTLLGILIWWLAIRSGPTVDSDTLRTSLVRKGTIENTLAASGEIVPESEQIIASPFDSDIQRVLLKSGTRVAINQPIMELDKEVVQAEYEQLKDQVSIKQNSIARQQVQLRRNVAEMEINNQIKRLRINDLRNDLTQLKRLNLVGGNTKEDVNQSELTLKVAQLEKKQLESELINRSRLIDLDLQAATLELTIQQKKLREIERKVQQANIVSKQNGVLTWVNDAIGTRVRTGENLARVAGLSGYLLKGSIADVQAPNVRVGQRTYAVINDVKLYGSINSVLPSVQNGTLSFTVRLDSSNHRLLRPNLKTELYLITDARADVLLVDNGPAFVGKRVSHVYVKEGKQLVRRAARAGATNLNTVELIGAIQPGERVVISDIDSFSDADILQLNQ